jgi:hypothetical protein
MHIVTFNGPTAKKPKRPEVKVLALEDLASLGEMDSGAAYTLDPDFDTMGTPASFKVAPGVMCLQRNDGFDLSRVTGLDAA